MDLNDPRWTSLTDGYRVVYDPRPALAALKINPAPEAAWSELWNKLHHQGDVGDASYAAVPELVRIAANSESVNWNFYALIATIEEARLLRKNPAIPDWILPAYRFAWEQLFRLAHRDLPTVADSIAIRTILTVLALHKGEITIARFASLEDDEREEMFKSYFGYTQID